MSEIVEDADKFNSILCVIAIILLIFVGGEFALILPQWLWILIAIALVGSLYRSLSED
jgi:hypothetical protein